MKKKASLLVSVAALAALCGAAQNPPDNPERPRLENAGVERLMQQKLDHAKGLLEGLALADHDRLIRHGTALRRVIQQAEWQVIATPQYRLHSDEMQRAVDKLLKGARAKNIDAAALGYVDMTLSCVRCHEYVREVRSTRLDPERDFLQSASLLAGSTTGRTGPVK